MGVAEESQDFISRRDAWARMSHASQIGSSALSGTSSRCLGNQRRLVEYRALSNSDNISINALQPQLQISTACKQPTANSKTRHFPSSRAKATARRLPRAVAAVTTIGYHLAHASPSAHRRASRIVFLSPAAERPFGTLFRSAEKQRKGKGQRVG